MDQNASRRRGSGRRRTTTTADGSYLLQCAIRRRTLTALQLASTYLLLEECPYPSKLCRADCMNEDCSHDDQLFVCVCPQSTSERSCIGPVNIAVGHQSSGSTYSYG
ncbi:hypothetical protein AVEN_245936-1 [Araneus ventricosus]|uniref:Uncharacterized protein n=1 Tax=Araneus ventricosus TaxID=182803 RepID=A0A4Y2W3E8_ARAVE|nr:hypothetical protein AVEN_245936-1 [Araneus ventricosus]